MAKAKKSTVKKSKVKKAKQSRELPLDDIRGQLPKLANYFSPTSTTDT